MSAAYTSDVDNGVPQTSRRGGSRPGGGGVTNGDVAKNGAKPSSAGARPGPVDPRTEDASAPRGVARSAKTIWRRPGAISPNTAKQREAGGIDGPIDFSVALPLSLAPSDPIVPEPAEPANDLLLVTEPVALAPTVESPAPAPNPTPQAWAPMELISPDAPEALTLATPILYDEAATVDDVTQIGPVLEHRPLLRPVHFRRAPKPRVRRVTRVVRHVDTWSVFKVSMVFSVFFYAVALVSGVLLWQVAYATGTIDNVQKFFEGFGWATFKFNGGQIYHNAWIAGLFVAVGMTGLAVLMATLFNLITDLVGGIRLSVLEEEVRTRAERGTEMARVTVAPAPGTPSPADEPTEAVTTAPDQVIVG